MGLADGIRRFLSKLTRPRLGERTSGRPPSGNGASSFHLWWAAPPGPITELGATLTVINPPVIDELYFFAIQATFRSDTGDEGGAHLGLQWNPRFVARTAVNWGGYDRNGSILAGTASSLPSSPSDPNTRDFDWQPERSYRLRIGPVEPDGETWWWPGSITDLRSGETTVVRRLATAGHSLARPVAWSEVFAPCQGPSVEVRWTDLAITTPDATHSVPRCTAAYQAVGAGGCSNTNSWASDGGFHQATAAVRRHTDGSTISL